MLGGAPKNLKVVVGDFQLTKRGRLHKTGDNAVHPTAIQHTEVILGSVAVGSWRRTSLNNRSPQRSDWSPPEVRYR